jgi:hypothetical protein
MELIIIMKKAVDMKKIVKRAVPRHRKDATNFVILGLIVITLILLVAMMIIQYNVAPALTNQQENNSNNLYQPPEGTSAMRIIRPASGDTIRGSIIGIKINVTNFQLVDIAANRPNIHNQGHIVYTLDSSREIKSIYKDYSMANVPKGVHTLTVELRNNDNTPLIPPIVSSVQVTVTG